MHKRVDLQERQRISHNREIVLAAGCIAADLLALQGLLSVGVVDPSTLISLCAVAMSVPALVAEIVNFQFDLDYGFYIFSAWGRRLTAWGGIGAIGTWIALASIFWHLSRIVAGVFLISTLISCILFIASGNHKNYVDDAERKKSNGNDLERQKSGS